MVKRWEVEGTEVEAGGRNLGGGNRGRRMRGRGWEVVYGCGGKGVKDGEVEGEGGVRGREGAPGGPGAARPLTRSTKWRQKKQTLSDQTR